jgi:hypothetical protein
VPYDPLSSQALAPPDFIVTENSQPVDTASYTYHLDGGFTVGRTLAALPAVDIPFGDQFYVLSYQILNPSVAAGGLADVELDYQFSERVTVEALRYLGFVHVVRIGHPEDKVANFNIPLAEESGNFGPRRYALNRHFRFTIPAGIPPGKYDVLFGIFNQYTGQTLSTPQGDFIRVGQLNVITGAPQ